MTVTYTASRSIRDGNETSLTGTESGTAELGQHVNAVIPAATDDQPVVIGAFEKADLLGLLMTSDQAGLVRMRGASPFAVVNIATLGDMATLVGGTFTIAGDQTAWIFPGDLFWIIDCTTPANDGLYVVIDSGFAAGVTTIEVYQQLGVINVAVIEAFDTVEAGAAGTTATKVQARSVAYPVTGAVLVEFVAPSTINLPGDLSFLQAHDKILVQEATTLANDQIYNVVSATFDGVDTAIIVEEATIAGEAGAADCTLFWIRDELMHRLIANQPLLWTLNGNGILCPVLEDITTLLVSNAHASLPADFRCRIFTVTP